MNLHTIAKLILTIEPTGLSKVRFAKTIYFVHKELIRKNLVPANDLEYIRMPLGPVPNGFMTLSKDFPDIRSSIVPSQLSYNAVEFTIDKPRRLWTGKKNPLYQTIESILADLRSVSTSLLVESSHMDESWRTHKNGDLYYIQESDLKNILPVRGDTKRLDSDDQLLQASLVKGMIDDIVKESTDLEYPDER